MWRLQLRCRPAARCLFPQLVEATAATSRATLHLGPRRQGFSDDVRAQMVDVSNKQATHRTARAACTVDVGLEVAQMLAAGTVPKGDVLTVSQVAGIMAAKRTPELLPLCHPLPLNRADVRCSVDAPCGKVDIVAEVSCTGPTGVEMESLTAAATSALCIYDMCKPHNKGIIIKDLRLLSKTGGKSGDYVAPE
mmetsp:Transcript_132393/g.264099  ORF Transcript_132393/g.264099 Transcript_132393/m.264099 type:complete len:193 (-) Transcript_132393:66-644(-)